MRPSSAEPPEETARRRVDALLADPFGQQVLRDLVPRGAQITTVAPDTPLTDAIQAAMHDSHGLPAFLAAIDPDRDDLVLLVVEASSEPGWVTLRRPGYRAATTEPGAPADIADTIRLFHQPAEE